MKVVATKSWAKSRPCGDEDTDTTLKGISPAWLVIVGILAMGAAWKGLDILMTKAVHAMDPTRTGSLGVVSTNKPPGVETNASGVQQSGPTFQGKVISAAVDSSRTGNPTPASYESPQRP